MFGFIKKLFSEETSQEQNKSIGGKYKAYSTADLIRITELREEGKSYQEIHEELGIPYGSVGYLVKQAKAMRGF